MSAVPGRPLDTAGAVTVRPARHADAALLPAVERSAAERFREVPGLERLADGAPQPEDRHRELIRHGLAWVAVGPDDAPLGFVNGEVDGDSLHVWELSVLRRQQGRGIGRLLMETAIAAARARGLGRLTLTTFRGVGFNEGFYRTLGFATVESPGTRLAKILAAEAAHGLPAHRRCAMELVLAAPAPLSSASAAPPAR